MRERLLVSACLLGERCRYNGGSNYDPAVAALACRFELVPVCPERLGGLPTPRVPSERVGDRIVNRAGEDVTAAFQLGAERTLEIALAGDIRLAVLKERSPSCGYGTIYDGTFTGAVVPGSGAAAELLSRRGIKICGESGLEALEERTGE